MNQKTAAVLAMMMLTTSGPAEFMAILSEICDYISENNFLDIPPGQDIFDLMRSCRAEVHKETQVVSQMMANVLDPIPDGEE